MAENKVQGCRVEVTHYLNNGKVWKKFQTNINCTPCYCDWYCWLLGMVINQWWYSQKKEDTANNIIIF